MHALDDQSAEFPSPASGGSVLGVSSCPQAAFPNRPAGSLSDAIPADNPVAAINLASLLASSGDLYDVPQFQRANVRRGSAADEFRGAG